MNKTGLEMDKLDILDVGCGYYAYMLQFLSSKCHSVTGIEFKVDENEFKKNNINYLLGEALETLKTLPDNSFNVIMILSCLEHVDMPVELLKEAKRVCKVNGLVLATSPSWFGKFIIENVVLRFFDKNKALKVQVNTHNTYFSKSQIWQVFRNAGFGATEIPVSSANFFCSVSALGKSTPQGMEDAL